MRMARRPRVWVLMPEISRFFGIVIRMHFVDHGPPHFHAAHGSDEAMVRIAPPEVLDGSLPRRALALTFEWARLRQAELLVNWHCLLVRLPAHRIPPLE